MKLVRDAFHDRTSLTASVLIGNFVSTKDVRPAEIEDNCGAERRHCPAAEEGTKRR